MKLLEVLQGLDYEVLKGNTDTEIREIQNDSRKVQPGDLFFCISGAVSDMNFFMRNKLSNRY